MGEPILVILESDLNGLPLMNATPRIRDFRTSSAVNYLGIATSYLPVSVTS